MVREFSAGGVVLRRMQERWWVAVIEPQSRRKPGAPASVLALPKGNVDKGEKPEETAVREVREETGVEADLLSKLTDIEYIYIRSWGGRERVFKSVSFFLLMYRSGRIGHITPAMRREVRQSLWLPLDEAPGKLSYRGERDVVKLAQRYLAAHPEP
ncbi:MAG: NUDIX domain-containing protein [Acidobacteriia bacterium]|nr:NUDIX domain-containing protein [Terriglobia bacterium]